MKKITSLLARFTMAMFTVYFAFTGMLKAQLVARAGVQLYTLDGGRLDFNDMGIFYDTGEHEGQKGHMAVACYLIHHGNDWLLWDTGNGDKMASEKNGEMKSGIHFSQQKTLVSQLSEIGLKSADIRYVALSHLHPDHTGNLYLFPNAQFLVSSKELKWALATPTPEGVERSLLTPLLKGNVKSSDDDIDVFGDSTVMLLRAPGHTPGHRILLVKLAHSGSILISADLYHTRENFEKGTLGVGNTDRAATLASFNRFNGLIVNKHARVIIQHSPEDFSKMPPFPKFLD